MTQFCFFLPLFSQNSIVSPESEMESLKEECDLAKKKCKEAQEKYFSESRRLKGIIDEMQGMALSSIMVLFQALPKFSM